MLQKIKQFAYCFIYLIVVSIVDFFGENNVT